MSIKEDACQECGERMDAKTEFFSPDTRYIVQRWDGYYYNGHRGNSLAWCDSLDDAHVFRTWRAAWAAARKSSIPARVLPHGVAV